jgi:hypothetical protein
MREEEIDLKNLLAKLASRSLAKSARVKERELSRQGNMHERKTTRKRRKMRRLWRRMRMIPSSTNLLKIRFDRNSF